MAAFRGRDAPFRLPIAGTQSLEMFQWLIVPMS
jgi:hypothetical protein